MHRQRWWNQKQKNKNRTTPPPFLRKELSLEDSPILEKAHNLCSNQTHTEAKHFLSLHSFNEKKGKKKAAYENDGNSISSRTVALGNIWTVSFKDSASAVH